MQLAGALMVLTAFALLQLKRLTATSVPYLVLNAVGSAVLATDASMDGNWGFVVLNVVWCAVSLASLVRRRAAEPDVSDASR